MMPVFDITLDLSRCGYEDSEVEHALWSWLVCLHSAGQITNDDYVFVWKDTTLRVTVVCPEREALFIKTPMKYARQQRARLEAITGGGITFEEAGMEPQEGAYEVPRRSSFYILRSGWFSPLICGDTFRPVPLYLIPPTDPDGDSYDNVRTWEYSYRRLYGLWLNGTVGEQFALRQMQDPRSTLSSIGRDLCHRIETLTGTPTYYFLMNDRHWSRKQDLSRKCPLTGKAWRIEGATTSDFIAFKCDASRLVSELSPSCRDA